MPVATFSRAIEAITALLAFGADPSLVDTQTNHTPAQWAPEMGNSELAERLSR